MPTSDPHRTPSTTRGSGTCPCGTGRQVESWAGAVHLASVQCVSAAALANGIKVNVTPSLMAQCAMTCNTNLKMDHLAFRSVCASPGRKYGRQHRGKAHAC